MIFTIFQAITFIVVFYGIYAHIAMKKEGASRFDQLSFVNSWLVVMTLLNAVCFYLALQDDNFVTKGIYGASLLASSFYWVVNYGRYSALKKIIYKNQK